MEAEAEVDTQAEVEAKGSEGDSGVSTGATLRLFGGVCLGVDSFPLIGGNIVLVLGFLHPYVTPIIFVMLVCLPIKYSHSSRALPRAFLYKFVICFFILILYLV
ncbi:hypothetical protein WH47_02545 [Habropoda laboriosa]|uniref:Uncharacterized protein n=1 Tax=Habropoda laboriosa TaxID=597456 RepID=A0A0L7QW66_9HYME|nr:hypothetical protein WH47_02545 [Habropoda laboriosa]